MILPKLTKKNKKVNKKRTLIKKNKKVNKKLRGGADKMDYKLGEKYYSAETETENSIKILINGAETSSEPTDIENKKKAINDGLKERTYKKGDYIEFTGKHEMNLKCTNISKDEAVFLVVKSIPSDKNPIEINYTESTESTESPASAESTESTGSTGSAESTGSGRSTYKRGPEAGAIIDLSDKVIFIGDKHYLSIDFELIKNEDDVSFSTGIKNLLEIHAKCIKFIFSNTENSKNYPDIIFNKAEIEFDLIEYIRTLNEKIQEFNKKTDTKKREIFSEFLEKLENPPKSEKVPIFKTKCDYKKIKENLDDIVTHLGTGEAKIGKIKTSRKSGKENEIEKTDGTELKGFKALMESEVELFTFLVKAKAEARAGAEAGAKGGGVEDHYKIGEDIYKVTNNENNIIVSKDNQDDNAKSNSKEIEKNNFTIPSNLYEKDSYIKCVKLDNNIFNLKCIDITSENAKFIVVNKIPDGEEPITVTKNTE